MHHNNPDTLLQESAEVAQKISNEVFTGRENLVCLSAMTMLLHEMVVDMYKKGMTQTSGLSGLKYHIEGLGQVFSHILMARFDIDELVDLSNRLREQIVGTSHEGVETFDDLLNRSAGEEMSQQDIGELIDRMIDEAE